MRQSLVRNGWPLAFAIAALFDLVVGAAFFIWGDQILAWSAIPTPPTPIYIHLPVAFVWVQAATYAFIAIDTVRFRDFAIIGILWKVAYLGVLAICLYMGMFPALFMGIGVADVAFLVLFVRFLQGDAPLAQASDGPWIVSSPGMAALSLVAIAQTFHFFEHVAQMIQIHVFGLSGPAARGIVGQLDIEWVHFLWNAFVVIAIVALVPRFWPNAWLIAAALIASWHMTEHVVLLRTYLITGVAGSPGLLASGGLIGGGLPISRPDLHFLYNLAETMPLLIAWRYEVRRLLRVDREATAAAAPPSVARV